MPSTDPRIPVLHSTKYLLELSDKAIDPANARELLQDARIRDLQDTVEILGRQLVDLLIFKRSVTQANHEGEPCQQKLENLTSQQK